MFYEGGGAELSEYFDSTSPTNFSAVFDSTRRRIVLQASPIVNSTELNRICTCTCFNCSLVASGGSTHPLQ